MCTKEIESEPSVCHLCKTPGSLHEAEGNISSCVKGQINLNSFFFSPKDIKEKVAVKAAR